MNILLTNDDGYNAVGLNILKKVLEAKHNVYVVAPSENRSAISHCITMHKNLSIVEHDKNVWSSSGVPVDCVVTGIKSNLIDKKIDLVISGINYGANIGTDILYSGTCAGARQGALYGIPSIAVSLDSYELSEKTTKAFNLFANFILNNLEKLVSLATFTKDAFFININAPLVDSFKGVKFSKSLSIREYGDSVKIVKNNEKTESVFTCGEPETSIEEDSDYYACKNGYISISFVKVQPVVSKIVDDIDFSL